MGWRNTEDGWPDCRATDEQRLFAWELVGRQNFGNRGEFDGDRIRQYAGMLGQTMVADMMSLPRPEATGGPDGGIDFLIGGKAVDLKTTLRTGRFRGHWFCPLKVSQVDNGGTAVYLFASMDRTESVLTVLGWIKKIDLRREWLRLKGVTDARDDGSVMRFHTDTYQIPVGALSPFSTGSAFETAMTMFG